MSCPRGGYPTIRHDEVRDLFAKLLIDVCHDVQREPKLQPLNGETLSRKSCTTDDEARLDIAASGFWGGRFQQTLFDVRVFNPNTVSYRPIHKRIEQEKKRKYEERILEV